MNYLVEWDPDEILENEYDDEGPDLGDTSGLTTVFD